LPNIIKSAHYSKEKFHIASKSAEPGGLRQIPVAIDEAPSFNLKQKQEELLVESLKKANSIVEKAHLEGMAMLQEIESSAKKRSELMRKSSQKEGYETGFDLGKNEGYPIGFQEGYEEGLRRAQNEYDYQIRSFEELNAAFETEKQNVMQTFKNGLDNLVFTIAKAVLKKEVSVHPEFLAQVAYDAITEYKEQSWVKLYLSEYSVKTLSENHPEFVQNLKGNVKLIADPNLTNSDCLCETPLQIVDAGIDTQFENILKAYAESDGTDNEEFSIQI